MAERELWGRVVSWGKNTGPLSIALLQTVGRERRRIVHFLYIAIVHGVLNRKQVRPFTVSDLLSSSGWGRGIRTPVTGTKKLLPITRL